MKRAKKRPLPSAILLTKMLSYRAAAQKAGMYNIPESAYIDACRRPSDDDKPDGEGHSCQRNRPEVHQRKALYSAPTSLISSGC